MKRLSTSPINVSMCWTSCLVPSVTMTNAWVSPRVNSDDPCVRGRTPASHVICPNIGRPAAVDAAAGRQHQLAQVLLLHRLIRVAHLGAALRELGRQRRLHLGPTRIQRGVALLFLADRHRLLDLLRRQRGHAVDDDRILRRRHELALGLADGRAQLLLQVQQRLRLLVRKHQGVDDDVLRHLGGSALDHHDRVAVAADHQINVGGLTFGERRVDEKLPPNPTDAHARIRAGEGNIADQQRARRAGHRQHVRAVLPVAGDDHRDDLRVEPPALGEQRAARPVDQARRQDLDLRHAPLALEIAAGNPAGRRGLFQVVAGQRHEVDARTNRHRRDRRDQDHRVAQAHDHRSVGLLGHATRLDGQLAAA